MDFHEQNVNLVLIKSFYFHFHLG